MACALVRDRSLRELEIRYTGMDIDRASIEWGQRNISPVTFNLSFYQADCVNRSYHPHGSASADAYTFPHRDPRGD